MSEEVLTAIGADLAVGCSTFVGYIFGSVEEFRKHRPYCDCEEHKKVRAEYLVMAQKKDGSQ